MMGNKERSFQPLLDVTLEDLVTKDHFYRHCQLERESCAFGTVGGMTDAGSHLAFRPYAAAPTPVTSSQTWNRC